MSAQGATRPRLLLPDGVWAIMCGLCGGGYFVLLVATGTTFFFPGNGGLTIGVATFWTTLAIIALQAVAVAWCGRFPLSVFCIVFVLFQVSLYVTIDRNFLVTPALLFATLTLTALLPRRVWMVFIGAAIGIDYGASLVVGYLYGGSLTLQAVVVIALRVVPTYAFAVVMGMLYASQQRLTRLEAERAEAVELAARYRTAAAVASERTRMAREIHDVAAHHLSGIVAHSRAAIRLREADPSLADDALESVRAESEQAMTSLRQVVGVLRQDAASSGVMSSGAMSSGAVATGAMATGAMATGAAATDAAAPSPTAGLGELIDALRRADPHVDIDVDGDTDDLAPAVVLAAFRIVQESLTNARKHAPGATARVRVTRGDQALEVTIANDAPDSPPPGPSRPGFGLVGMRERVSLLGGAIRIGPTADGGWETRTVLPLDRPGGVG